MSAVADVLNGAAELIERDGWCQRNFRCCQSGERCLAGALIDVARCNSLYWPAREYVASVVGSLLIASWNDDLGRTKAEVVAALRAAAKLAAAEVQVP